jgi:hypothetical protein
MWMRPEILITNVDEAGDFNHKWPEILITNVKGLARENQSKPTGIVTHPIVPYLAPQYS